VNAFDKKKLSERDICTKFITPAIEAAGWDKTTHFLEEVNVTEGRIIVRGNMWHRDTKKTRRQADYVLFYKPNIPIAIIEAKDNNHELGDGMQQALEYSDLMQVPFAISSNGDAFLLHDKTGLSAKVEEEIVLNAFPSPENLWHRYCAWKGITAAEEPVITQDYYTDGSGKKPRYYQLNAINRTIEAIAKGQDRILLVMATGTGKTYTAFQIIYRLWKSESWKPNKQKRILFLADRNILVDQTMSNDFKPFKSAMAKLSPKSKTIEDNKGVKFDIASAMDVKTRTVNKSYEIYLSLYQAVSSPNEEERNYYKQFSPDFFDLVVVDECHRGSAAEDSAWREILEYFSSAAQIGLTATPKETKDVSNITYFKEPIYTYSLKQGIEDGFLAPYKVIRIDIDKDLQGWRPTRGQLDKYGNEIPDRIYNQKDFDKELIIEKRRELVAKKVSDYLRATSRYDKTIVFCENVPHAEGMRQALTNENADLITENRKYVMRITGDEKEGKAELDNFIMPEERYPVIACTSKLMSTGVDAQTCKLIVLDKQIKSITEFKQIIGRGTRINEDYNKTFFTIMDFRKATDNFADPAFDGDPVVIYQPTEDDPIIPPDDIYEPQGEDGAPPTLPEDDFIINGGNWLPDDNDVRPKKYVVNDVSVKVLTERVQYLDAEGKLITESLKDYTRRNVREEYESLEAFLKRWQTEERKQVILDELKTHGVFFDALKQEVGKDLSDFDLLCHIAFDRPPLTRKERADNVKKRDYFTKYGDKARQVLSALLDKYADGGVETLDDIDILKVQPFTDFGTPVEIIKAFGGKEAFFSALRELEAQLYEVA